MASIAASQIIAAAPSTVRAAPVHLGVNAKGTHIVYASNKAIFVRSLEDPATAIQYTGHTQQTTVAKFSPSGNYIASGDVSGAVRIWSCDTAEQILKNEVKVLNGRITDLSWDSDSQRIIAVGDGKERWGHAFTFDSGNTVGEVTGHSSLPNVVAIRQSRPFRAATAGDDGNIVFYHGAPYRYDKTIKKHTKFVYDVKFSPDGSKFVSVGADSRIFIYDGKTGDDLKELIDENNGHKGSIFSVSWDPSSEKILTSSADQTTKIWSVERSSVLKTWHLSEDISVNGQQVGNIWTEKYIVSLSFSGRLNFLSQDSDEVINVVSGHQKSITALAISQDLSELYTGSYDTTSFHWLVKDGSAKRVQGGGHATTVKQIIRGRSSMLSIGLDNTIRHIQGTSYESDTITTNDNLNGIAVLGDGRYVVATSAAIAVYQESSQVNEAKLSYQALACAAVGDIVAVGAEDGKIYLYESSLSLTRTLSANRASITCLVISSDGTMLVAGDSSGKIILYSLSTGETITTRWAFHVGRITSIQFSPSGKKVLSTSLDTHIYIWSVSVPTKKIALKNAHQGGVNGAVWVSEDSIISAGADAALKRWDNLII